MEHSTVKKVRFLPSLIVSIFLLAVTFGVTKAEASTVNLQQPIQLAWWGGGWHHGWHNGWGGGGWNRGWGGGESCHCWINRWGHERCNCD